MIRFHQVKKSFGERQVLKGLSFEVMESEILFVLGTSGTGKSVLLKNLVGLLTPDSGEIWVDGQEISKFTEDQYLEVRKKVGMVFQQPALFDSFTIFQNIAFGLERLTNLNSKQIQERVKESLSLVHLHEVEDLFPPQISYGMQKRASLARTVALRPKVLLFDEPTTGLDPITTQAVNQLIQELSRTLKTTSVVVSHDMKCALDIADRIIVLDKGEIVEQGPTSKVKVSQVPLVKDFLAEVLEAEQV